MEVDVVEVDADVAIVIDVAVVDYQVSVAFLELDADFASANEQVRQGGLHGLFEAQTDRFGVGAADFDARYDGQALAFPDLVSDACAAMITQAAPLPMSESLPAAFRSIRIVRVRRYLPFGK